MGKSKKINILFVITKLELGGAQKQLLSLIRGLDQEKFTPFLFTAQEGLLLSEAVKINGLTVKKSKSLERPINLWNDLVTVFEIYTYIKEKQVSLVHTHSSKAGILGRIAARLAGAKIILHTVHGWSFHDYQGQFLRKFYICLERIAGKFTDCIIVVSRHDREKGLANRIVRPEKYQLIRYGIDYAQFNRRTSIFKEKLGVGPGVKIVTNISCFKPQKACLDFVKLAALVSRRLPETKFILVGDGVMRLAVETAKEKYALGERLILTGWRSDISEILSATSVSVLTSSWEGLPITVLEAICCGCPVVATDTGGVRDVIEDGKTGFLTACGDMENMCAKVTSLLEDELLRERISQQAKINLGDDFSLTRMLKSHCDLYESLILFKGANNAN